MSDDGFGFSITVVGLGLIGGSYAKALKSLGYKVFGVDNDESILKTAEDMEIIDSGYVNPKDALCKSDIVIIAIYPKMVIKFIKDNMDYFKKGAIITDTAGIKDEVVTKVQEMLRCDLDFIGGHPMAGKEGKGLEQSSADIFKGANYILTLTPHNKDEDIKIIKAMIKKLGCGRIIKVSTKEHDKIIAYTSQLPHILAVSLINSSSIDGLHNFIGGSFKDATRVAVNNSKLWTELILDNKENVLNMVKSMEDEIDSIKEAIENDDAHFLKSKFDSANEIRKGINNENS